MNIFTRKNQSEDVHIEERPETNPVPTDDDSGLKLSALHTDWSEIRGDSELSVVYPKSLIPLCI